MDAAGFGYLPAELDGAMSRSCARFSERRYGWAPSPEDVHPIADVITGLELAIEHFSAPGSAVILPTPAYMPFFTVPQAMGRELIRVPMVDVGGRWTHDLDGIERAFAAAGGLLVLCNPHNPLGRVFTRAELGAVVEVVERRGGRVFADEIHAPLTYAGHRHVPYASISDTAAGHSVTAVSASKAWNLAGLKCAQLIITNRADAAVWRPIEYMAEHGAGTLGVVANTVAYDEGEGWLDEVLTYLSDNRALLGERLRTDLPQIGYREPEGTYLAWLDCRAVDLGDDPAGYFREHAGVALVDGRACGLPGHVRLNFATPRPILTRILDAMVGATAGTTPR